MGDKSGIQWTDATWNPVTGCTKVSPGCKNCYAEGVAERFWGARKFTDVRCHPGRLLTPLHWKKPRRVFVNSMSDLFHENVPDQFIEQIFAVMHEARQHQFQILTKRPERMREFCKHREGSIPEEKIRFPPSNVALGVSVEDQNTADERIPILLQTPAAVRFLSVEPLLGPVDIRDWTYKLDWVIVGGESGRAARPCDLEWIRSIVGQCQANEVPCFVKQLGSRAETMGAAWVTLHGHGGAPMEWPADLRVREFPRAQL